jgi:hypothetical protein
VNVEIAVEGLKKSLQGIDYVGWVSPGEKYKDNWICHRKAFGLLGK